MNHKLAIVALVMVTFAAVPVTEAKQFSDAAIKQKLIQESIAEYPGNCPCPYNTDRRGHACGRRSAYNRAGGYAPLCYPEDVTPEMVKEYRQRVSK